MNNVCVSVRWRSRRGSTCVASPMASVSNLPSSTLRAWWVRCCRSWWRPVGSNCTGSWWNTRSRGFQTSTCRSSTSGTSPLPPSTRWRPREPQTIATCCREKTSGTRRRHGYSPTNSPGTATTFRQSGRRTCTCGSTAYSTSSVANGWRLSTKSLMLDNTRMKTVLGVKPRSINTTLIDMGYSLIDTELVKKPINYTARASGEFV